jgi:hypothetical protein
MTKDSHKVHPAADLFPMMDKAALKELADNIKSKGQQFPVTFWKKDGSLLDGRNRLAACKARGIEPMTDQYDGDDPVGFIESANIHRRHLTQKQKRDRIDQLLKMDSTLSDRATAEKAKSTAKTVAKRRRKLESSAEIPHQTKRTDKRGNSQPASKPKVVKVAGTNAPAASKVIQLEITPEQRRAPNAMLDAPPQDRALNDFKYACNTYVPRMSGEQVKEAVAHLQQCVEAKAKASRPQNGAAVGSA